MGREELASSAATIMPYSSPCRMVAERPKFAREPRKEPVGEVDAKGTERKCKGEKERLEKGPWMRQKQGEERRKRGKVGEREGDPVLRLVLVEEQERGSRM
jgi:hypothetical protein